MRLPHWSRRRFIANGVGGVAALRLGASHALAATPAESPCLLIQEQEEGPFYVDREILRKDITEGRPGVPLLLRIKLVDVKLCKPIENAALDIWHCDALGDYSGYTNLKLGPPPGGPGGPPKVQPTDQEIFLRGVQLSDAAGVAEFVTIYPGCYTGRVNHIHLKAHIGGHGSGGRYQGGHVAHTGQIFFPEETTKQVIALEPYAKHDIERTTLAEDNVFNSQHGSQAIAQLIASKNGAPSSGYIATITVGIDPDATPRPKRPGPPNG